MLKKHEVEKTEMQIAHILYDKSWYSDWGGCLLKAGEIINLPQIKIDKRKLEVEGKE